MRINGLKKLYLAMGIAGVSVLVNGVTVHAQTTESSAENVVKIKSNQNQHDNRGFLDQALPGKSSSQW